MTMGGGTKFAIHTPEVLRRADWLLEQMTGYGPLGITRDELRAQVNMPRTNVYDLLHVLMAQKRVIRVTLHTGGRGRPRVSFVPVQGQRPAASTTGATA